MHPRTAHRQTELQVLLGHEQKIPIQGARQRHCGCYRAPARPQRLGPLLLPGNKLPLRLIPGRKRKLCLEHSGLIHLLGSGMEGQGETLLFPEAVAIRASAPCERGIVLKGTLR